MPWIEDKGTQGSCFVWTIQNFSYCLQKPGEFLDSPSFVLKDNVTDTCRFRLYPRGTQVGSSADSKTIFFQICFETCPTSIASAELALSIQTASGSFKTLVDSMYGCTVHAHPICLTRKDLLGKEGEICLNNDSLTFRCRIWTLDGELLPPLHCHMRTIINVERTISTWRLKKLRQNTSSNELIAIPLTTLQMQSLIAVKLFSCKESFSGDSMKVEIKQIDKDEPCFFTCDLRLSKVGGKVVHSVREEHLFDASEVLQVWTLPYAPPSQICDVKKTYLTCELAVSFGNENSWVERFRIDETEQVHYDWKVQKIFTDSWKDDLKRFYSSGLFNDFIIRTPSKEFPVHKAILFARSTVFHAMFEQDMEVKRTGVVDIKDIDADIIYKMLLFAYCDVVEDLDCDVASKLYRAAHRYKITALKRRCSDFLKENLSVSNVCEVLVLANEHRDEELKSFVVDFIVEHAAEVLPSVEWKTFMQNQTYLAAKIMHSLLLQKS